MNDVTRPSNTRVDPLTERLRFLRPTAKYKFAKDQYYMVGEVMHEAAHEIERLERELAQMASLAGNVLPQLHEAVTRASNEPPAVPEINSLSNMTVVRICTAYESGYGRGQSGRDLAQPYAAGCPEATAYYEGWVSGVRRAAQPPGESQEAVRLRQFVESALEDCGCDHVVVDLMAAMRREWLYQQLPGWDRNNPTERPPETKEVGHE